MKDQYFGDVNDYRKYGLLRTLLQPTELSLAVAWMLTSGDGSTDGEKTDYLNNAADFREYDPELFDFLRDTVAKQQRREVQAIEDTDLLPNATFHSSVLSASGNRADYFESITDCDLSESLVFFDPDNGLEIASKQKGHAGSEKYLYWDEVLNVWSEGASLLVYQHYPRRPREEYTRERVDQLSRRVEDAPWIAEVHTSHVLFLIAPQPSHAHHLKRGLKQVDAQWGDEFSSVQTLSAK